MKLMTHAMFVIVLSQPELFKVFENFILLSGIMRFKKEQNKCFPISILSNEVIKLVGYMATFDVN